MKQDPTGTPLDQGRLGGQPPHHPAGREARTLLEASFRLLSRVTGHRRPPLLFATAFFFAGAAALGDDAIFNVASGPLPTVLSTITQAFEADRFTLAEAIRLMFGQSRVGTGPRDLDHPDLDENPVRELTVRLGDSPFKAYFQGSSNLKMIGGPYLYNEVQGGAGFEYDFVGTDNVLVALRFSPLYGELAIARTLAQAPSIPGLPTEAFLGSALGIELSRRFGDVDVGARAYARGLVELGGRQAAGLSLYGAAYARIRLADLDFDRRTGAPDRSLFLRGTLNVYDRGAELDDFYALGLQERFWEAMVYFEVK